MTIGQRRKPIIDGGHWPVPDEARKSEEGGLSQAATLGPHGRYERQK